MGNIPPLIIPVIIFMIPIIAILTAHQQKMAKIMHESRPQFDPNELSALRHEVRELKELVHTQMLAIDSLSGRAPSAPAIPADVQQRLRSLE
jgi:hypothetical protein